jgi:hypothetical protein
MLSSSFPVLYFMTIIVNGMSSPQGLLSELARQLQYVRSLPQGTATHLRCPENSKLLVGLHRQAIGDALGQPDYIDTRSVGLPTSAASWTYFFTSPIPRRQRGGGFPEFTFQFGEGDHVVAVTCYYSR